MRGLGRGETGEGRKEGVVQVLVGMQKRWTYSGNGELISTCTNSLRQNFSYEKNQRHCQQDCMHGGDKSIQEKRQCLHGKRVGNQQCDEELMTSREQLMNLARSESAKRQMQKARRLAYIASSTHTHPPILTTVPMATG
ncbi:hypothetical protein cyc_08941 [Cyclospora cayetanensis]|uniref:Uncharacterized protein n=1 Tax=Cyclospora cayetanensis TaxID=88456 RepID=A0A1D3D432_9EIME|nr:hypothetical protein cyc_08941 [Cyclospora cayetanensis]